MKKIRLHSLILALIILTSSLHTASAKHPWDNDLANINENRLYTHNCKHRKITILSVPQFIGNILIRFFQKFISPQDGPNCRFRPTCSEYGRRAIIKHGLILGSFLAGERLIRCNPYSPPGKDPVPDKIFTEE